jgi:hypothetical protein
MYVLTIERAIDVSARRRTKDCCHNQLPLTNHFSPLTLPVLPLVPPVLVRYKHDQCFRLTFFDNQSVITSK